MPDIGSILRDMGIPWPEADENALREAATAWYRLADSLGDGCGRANSAADSLTSNNEGAAIEAFRDYWNKYGDRRKGALPLAAEACRDMGSACIKYADDVEKVKRTIEEAGAEAGVTVAVGTVLAFGTFGLTEAGADVAAGTILAFASRAVASLGATAAELMAELDAGAVADAMTAIAAAIRVSLTSVDAATVAGAGMTGTVSGVISAGVDDMANDQIRQLFGDKPLSADQETKDLVESGIVSGGVGGMIGKLGTLGQAQLAQLLKDAASSISDTDLHLGAQMYGLARQVEGLAGKISTGVLTKAATQLVTAQQVDAKKIAESRIPQLIQSAIVKGGS